MSHKIKFIFKIITKEQYPNHLISHKFSKVFSLKRKTTIIFFLQKDNSIKIKITPHNNIITQNLLINNNFSKLIIMEADKEDLYSRIKIMGVTF